MENEVFIPHWERVEKYLEEKTLGGLLMALIEADKLLNIELKKKGYPGKNVTERINLAKEEFSNPGSLLKAKKIKSDVLTKTDLKLTSLDIEDALSAYRQALIDLASAKKKKLRVGERLFLYFDYYFPSKLGTLKKIAVLVAFFFVAVLFLSDTWTGNRIVTGIVWLTHQIFSWVLAFILLALGILLTIAITLFYFEKRRRDSESR